MNKDKCFYLGHVTKTKGLKGEVTIFIDADNPQEYSKMESVFLDIRNELIPFFIESIQVKHSGHANLKFEDINSEEEAKSLIKIGLFLPLTVLPKLKGNKFYYHEIEGFNVIDSKEGNLGVVETVLDLPNNPLIQVINGEEEILVPILQDVIELVDRDKKEVHVTMPEGLLDVYKNSDDEL